VGFVTVRVDGRGVVVWCDDWAEARRLAYCGMFFKLAPNGQVLWGGP
jgi:hypothetical protein